MRSDPIRTALRALLALSALLSVAWAGEGSAGREPPPVSAPSQIPGEQLAYVCEGGTLSGYASGNCLPTPWYCANIDPYDPVCAWCASINWSHPYCQ